MLVLRFEKRFGGVGRGVEEERCCCGIEEGGAEREAGRSVEGVSWVVVVVI
jgi:hypothetical protein